MAPISAFHSCIIFFTTLSSIPISSFSLQSLTHHKIPNFGPEIALFGDAHIVAGETAVRLALPSDSSSGLLLHPRPFKFLHPNSCDPTSFSSEFSFTISPSVVLVFVPRLESVQYGKSRQNKFLGIEFDNSMVGVDVGNSVFSRVANVSCLVIKSGEKLKSWVDYDAVSKKLEVRLARFGEMRPYDPVLTHVVDLGQMWSDEDVFVGLRSWSGGSSETSSVYSWEFTTSARAGVRRRRRICPMTVLAGVIFGTACGTLFAFVVLFVWAMLGNKCNVLLPVVEHRFRYQGVDVVVEN